MNYETIGKVHNKDKVAQIHCVKHVPLTSFHLKDECYLLLLLTEGHFSFTVDGRRFTATAPCFVCFDEKADVTVTSKAHTMCHAAFFHPMFLNVNMTFELLRSPQYHDVASQHDMFMLRPFTEPSYIVPIPEEHLEHIEATFNNMARELSEQRDWYWSCRSRSYFMELLLLLERLYGITDYGVETENTDMSFASKTPAIKDALVFIETHYAEELRLARIAKACHISSVALSALFKAELGQAPSEYLTAYRIKVAKKQLSFTDIPIKEIALRCGFKTVPHFSRVFKELTGSTPAQYRAETVQNRKNAMSKRKLIAYTRERLADANLVFEEPALPQIFVLLSDSGELCEYTGIDDRKFMQILSEARIKRVTRVVCMRKSGLLAMPPISFLEIIRHAHDDNLQTQILLEGREGYYSKTIAQVFETPKRRARPHRGDLQSIYEGLVKKLNACFDPDFMSINIRTLHDTLVGEELMTEVADFLEDHTAFVIEDQRYLAFEVLLTADIQNAAYYHFVYALLHCAEQDGSPDAIERLYGSLLSAFDPICFFLHERGIAKLREMGFETHARRLQEDSERVRRERRFFRSYRYASDALDVVFTEIARRQMQMENNEDCGSHPDVVVIGYQLNIGDVRGEIDGDGRKALFAEMEPFLVDETERLFHIARDEYERLLSAAKNGKPIRVWRNLREPHSACGFAFVCEALKEYECPLTVVDAPDGFPGWEVVKKFVPFLLHEQAVSDEEKRHFADMWQRVREENAPLRAYVDNTLRSFSAEHYDADLLRLLPESRAVCVGETLGRLLAPDHDSRSGVFITWYEHRIQKLIAQGTLEVIVNSEDVNDLIIRRKTDKPLSAEDVYTIARSRITNVERSDRLPAPLLYTMLSSTGKVYFFKNDAVDEMVDILKRAADTEIACWVTLWGNMPPTLDLPSYTARQTVLELNDNNAQTQLLVPGLKSRQTKSLKECI